MNIGATSSQSDSQPSPPVTGSSIVWLQVGQLITGTDAQPIRDAHIVYDSEQIRYVGRPDFPPDPSILTPGQRVPDAYLPLYTLLPGLIEAHAHLFLEGGELDFQKRRDYLAQNSESLLNHAKQRLEKLVRLGVMAYRDAGDKNGVGLALSKLYKNADRPLMPYVDSPGAAIHHQGRYGSFMADPIEAHPSLEDVVAARVAAGADRIKIIPTGIINFKEGAVTKAPQMSTEEIASLVAAARRYGKQTFAHATGDLGIDRAIDGGVDSIEHGFFVREDQLARMRDKDIAWVPTFAPVQVQVDEADRMGWDEKTVANLRRILDQHAALLVKAREMGVTIIAGSDAGSCGVAHGIGFQFELELMERAGLSSLDVINAATGKSAQRFGYYEKIGRIQVGCRTRFILTKHSPLETVANLRKPKLCVFDGLLLHSKKIDPLGL